jgi:hypothetical protein
MPVQRSFEPPKTLVIVLSSLERIVLEVVIFSVFPKFL